MKQKSNPDPRDGLMAALSAVEQVIAAIPVAPPVLTIQHFESAYSVDLYFRFDPAGVVAFAAAFEVEVDERDTTKGAPHVEAYVKAFGHEVRAWWTGDVPALVSLPAAWSVTAVSA